MLHLQVYVAADRTASSSDRWTRQGGASSLIPDESPRIQNSRKRWIGSRFILTKVSSVTQSTVDSLLCPMVNFDATTHSTEHIMRHGQGLASIFSLTAILRRSTAKVCPK